jgi:hypothetical protein
MNLLLLLFFLPLASDLLEYRIGLLLGVILEHLLDRMIHIDLHDLFSDLPLQLLIQIIHRLLLQTCLYLNLILFTSVYRIDSIRKWHLKRLQT